MLSPVLSLIAKDKEAGSVTLRDTTGAYNVSTNPGGYGSPNPTSPPARVGFTFRYWDEDDPYSNQVIADSGIITALLGTDGYTFTGTMLGLSDGLLLSAVHHIKYYVFEAQGGVTAALVNGSKKITLTGLDPTSINAAYKAIIILTGVDVIKTTVLLLDRSEIWTSTELYVNTAWSLDTVSGYHIQLATEGDLKVFYDSLATQCIVDSTVRYARRTVDCDRDVVDGIIDLLAMKVAAQSKFGCDDFDGANAMLEMIDEQCGECFQLVCQTWT